MPDKSADKQTSEAVLPLPPVKTLDGVPTVYVINTDPAFLEMVADLLADERVHVLLEQMRPNIEVTLDNLRSAQPDMLILDVVPRKDLAPQLLERISQDEGLSKIPVMLASTNAGVAEALAQEHASVVRDVLPKPFDMDEFLTKVNALLGN
jgi:DNA-binding response OmpR family regulator